LSPRKKKAAKKPLLTRLFGAGDEKASAKGKSKARKKDKRAARENGKAPAAAQEKAPAKARPLTPLERSIEEIRRMAKVGESDPQRLAMLLSNLLGAEKRKRQIEQQKFDDMVWDIVNRSEQGGDEEG
jgi:hypothetical protein